MMGCTSPLLLGTIVRSHLTRDGGGEPTKEGFLDELPLC